MTWACVQEVDSGAKTDAGTGTRTLTIAGAVAGNLLVVTAMVYGGINYPTDTVGITGSGTWTLVSYFSNTITFGHVFMWAKEATGGETTITVTITNGLRLAVWAAEYSGNDHMTLDGVGGEYSGGNGRVGYVVSYPAPAYQDGLWVGISGGYNSAASGPGTATIELLHGATQRGAQISHFPTSSLSVMARVYDKLSATGDDSLDIALVPNQANHDNVACCAVFKAAGAVPSRTKVSGTGPATFVDLKTAASAAGGSGSVGFTPSAGTYGDSNLMVAVVTLDPARSIVTVPTGWTLYGSPVTINTGGATLMHRVYYKVCAGETGGSYTWVFDAVGICSIVVNIYGGGTYTPDVAPTFYQTTNAETFHSGPGRNWTGQIGPVQPGVSCIFWHYNGTSGLLSQDAYVSAGGTNPGGGSSFGHKVGLTYRLPATAGMAQDYFTVAEPGAGNGTSDLQFISFSFAITVGNDVWAWHAGGSEAWK